MKTRQPFAIALLAAATVLACGQKKDTAKPDDVTACTEEAKVCEDGSSVSRQGPDCEFPACPGEDEAANADAGDEPDESLPEDEEEADEASEEDEAE